MRLIVRKVRTIIYSCWKHNLYGWLFFVIMNASMGTLMVIQNKPILAFQQAASLCVVVCGFITLIKVNRRHGTYKTIN